MKIAVVSDIHGNHVAFKAVLCEARRLQIDYFFVLGDIVGYYYHPDLIMEWLGEWPHELIQGNHEMMLRSIEEGQADLQIIKQYYGSGLEHAIKKLPAAARERLITLPATKKVELNNLRFQLCHGAPWDRDQYIYPDSSAKVLEKCATYEADFVFLGHTHYPFAYCKEKTVVANVGSVGQARDKSGMASWLTVDSRNRSMTFHHTPYKVKEVLTEVSVFDPAISYLSEVLQR